MSSLESRITLQTSRLNLLQHALDKFSDLDVNMITRPQVQTRLDLVEANWAKFDRDHERICDVKSDTIKDIPYIKQDYYGIAQEAYASSKASLQDLLNQIAAANPAPGVSIVDLSTTGGTQQYRHNLPKISLPHFSGDYQAWRPFYDMFMSIVGSNVDLSAVEKMHYLKSCLTGDAAKLIANFTISGENFAPAWDKLVARYENKRILIHKHIESIFKTKALTTKSAHGLNCLLSTINESLGALKALGVPVSHWDDIMVFILTQRLDPETHEAWEVHLGSHLAPPLYSELETFIEGRARALENIEEREVASTSSRKLSTFNKSRSSSKSHVSSLHRSPVPSTRGQVCSLCSSSHYVTNCSQYQSKTPLQKREFITSNNLCFNCLGPHRVRDCRSTKTCHTCGGHHHTTIHEVAYRTSEAPQNSSNETAQHKVQSSRGPAATSSASVNTAVVHHSLSTQSLHPPAILLATAQVKVFNIHGENLQARVLIDQGSEISFISERLVQRLHLKRSTASIPLTGIGATQSATTRGIVTCKLSPLFHCNVSCSVTAYILPKLTSTLPSLQPVVHHWPHLNGLQLADPDYTTPGAIDLILGADVYCNIIQSKLVKGPPNTPIAQATIFGWIISGPVETASTLSRACTHHCQLDFNLNDLLQRFWTQEEVSDFSEPLTDDETECEKHFLSTHTRDMSGRYTVHLPLKKSVDELGESKMTAMRVLNSLDRRLTSNEQYRRLYSQFLSEYESLDHMIKVSAQDPEPSHVYYLPHHGVLREHSSTTKLRVVFNGSARTISGKSLNDILHTGAKLQIDLPDVLLWFRRFRYVFATDIEKMYRQILVHHDDWNLQRILWKDDTQTVHAYQLKTVTYGLACAPFLALRTLTQLINDHGCNYPLAVPVLTKGRYVDDVFGGADTIAQCQEIITQVDQLCKAGCFPLQKWTSNHEAILSGISSNRHAHQSSRSIDEEILVHTLGLLWTPSSDFFHFSVSSTSHEKLTKRYVLSQVAQLFDPLGFISPVTIRAKIFIQQLWLVKLDWDDQLPSHLESQWNEFKHQLRDLSDLRIPRYLGLTASTSSSIELHGFSDASQFAMAAAVYLRINTKTDVQVALICSKTKVAPLKTMTIPRLELCAAALLTRLMSYVCKVMDLQNVSIWMWTDSSVALTWITNQPSKWKDFVRNRVSYINEVLPTARWRFVPGKENPSDCASRGITPLQLKNHNLWWNGPPWLSKEHGTWPLSTAQATAEANVEQRKQPLASYHSSVSEPELLLRFSSLIKLLRVTAWCIRFISSCTARQKSSSSIRSAFLNPAEIQHAIHHWVRVCQTSAFSNEFKQLNNG